MDFAIPEPLQREHEELHDALRQATRIEGAVGEAARELARRMHPHFVKEDQIALPPLGLLQALARGECSPDMAEVLVLTDRLEAELPGMLREHEEIVAALQQLLTTAESAQRDDVVEFARRLMLHAQTEEQVMYPAALLVGRYLRLRLGEGVSA